jgi:Fur family iron response transcriptional regulator
VSREKRYGNRSGFTADEATRFLTELAGIFGSAPYIRRHLQIRRSIVTIGVLMPADTKSIIEQKLLSHGVKVTPQRIEIGKLLLSTPCHMSAEQILTCLRDSGTPVSKATVYNTLKLFSRKGIVRAVAVDPSHLVYDSTVDRHHHFYNVDTGELTDIDATELKINGLPDLPTGTRAESVELIIRLRSEEA